ncbi:Sarcosine/dimethylglycine N-methyltransferase [Methylococcales bacterium]|nr:Sarcosine/dimethylglycine N-methyltransferase [Methylococcales bacterium]
MGNKLIARIELFMRETSFSLRTNLLSKLMLLGNAESNAVICARQLSRVLESNQSNKFVDNLSQNDPLCLSNVSNFQDYSVIELSDLSSKLFKDVVQKGGETSDALILEQLKIILNGLDSCGYFNQLEESEKNAVIGESSESVMTLINFSSTIRNKWVADKAQSVASGALVLDAGAGECQYKSLFAHTNYKAQDFAQYKGSQEGVQKESWNYGGIDYVSDIVSIPVADAEFDVVLCTEVLEHVPDPVAAITELTRVLKPGGRLLLTAPLGCGLHQQPFHYYGGFTPHFYRMVFDQVGIETIEILPIGGLLRHVAQEVHRVGRVLEQSDNSKFNNVHRYLFMDWLPRYLSSNDSANMVEEFTVGYLIEGKKKTSLTS